MKSVDLGGSLATERKLRRGSRVTLKASVQKKRSR